ncbi:uncharacterized protein BT62DRAFT_800 [Guyanagaster necrorhizus]|uniref:Uncharacterized protein n=1 Tax=Guyanagaster necrorhizus TaxID=856835 RepID=A0A9P7W4H7_9AGAR|nr:uncharacterized protein BT62DRAFT_800 [Guyanagaster necrorhizus MCA 3950]KAG7452424.1 hypothetical protein BT62DRAFT_800 [Guyanagaster necrorhizus MCA 3950]
MVMGRKKRRVKASLSLRTLKQGNRGLNLVIQIRFLQWELCEAYANKMQGSPPSSISYSWNRPGLRCKSVVIGAFSLLVIFSQLRSMLEHPDLRRVLDCQPD